MARWKWSGMFSAEIPDEWEVRERDGLLEFVPPRPVGAAQVSVLRRTKGPFLDAGEAAALARDFATKQGADALPQVEEVPRDGASIASTSFSTANAEGVLHWDVTIVVWPDRALRCTYCHDGSDEKLRLDARAVFASIDRSG